MKYLLVGGLFITIILGLFLNKYRKKSPETPFDPQIDVMNIKEKCKGKDIYRQKDICYKKALRNIAKEYDALSATKVFFLLQQSNIIDATYDEHQYAHEIGRATAEYKGINVKSFLSCPSDYNYGCQHGFFEYSLSQSNSYKEAATRICENLREKYPTKMYFYCYHGVGHGVMMAKAYKLNESLDVCNELPNKQAQDGCWQGVFMEGTNQVMSSNVLVAGFDNLDPLSPCDRVESKYRWECYINHSGYLMKVTSNDIRKSAEMCLTASDEGKVPCIQSLGLMASNPIWQRGILNVDTEKDKKKNVEVTWQLCREMPNQARKDCIIGAVGNILNFDQTDLTRASSFCKIVDVVYQNECYKEIGRSVEVQVSTNGQAESLCDKLSEGNPREQCKLGIKPMDL